MERLPRDINNELIGTLPYPNLINLCKTNKKWANICKDENTWKILLNRDFPRLKPLKSTAYRKLYEDLWNNINNSIDELIKNHLIANPRYANIILMKEDLFDIIRNFMLKYWNRKEYDFIAWNNLKIEIITVLSGLDPSYIGSGNQQLEPGDFDQDDILPIKILLDDYDFVYDE